MVTPYAGVWIEIVNLGMGRKWSVVTPYAGVWIEMTQNYLLRTGNMSLPTRECGLKWWKRQEGLEMHGHSLRGSVD